MIIDFHCHIGEDEDGTRQSSEELRTESLRLGILKCVVFPSGKKNVEAASINLAEAPQKEFFPFLRFNPKRISAKRLASLLDAHKFLGIKLHPSLEKFDPLAQKYSAVYEEIEKRNLPVLIHSKWNNLNTDPHRLVILAERFPKLNIILAHFAMGYPHVFDFIKKLPNLFVETSIVSSPAMISSAVKSVGSTKILFGSDAPYSDQEIELLKVLKANISEGDKENILYKNAAKLLNIELETFNKTNS